MLIKQLFVMFIKKAEENSAQLENLSLAKSQLGEL